MIYNTYIFDLDGTLLNTIDDLAASTNYALAVHHLPTHTTDDVRRMVGNGVRMLMERAVPGGAGHPQFDDVLATFKDHYSQHALDTTRPYDGVSDVLAALKRRGCCIAVVSNKFDAATKQLCRHFFPTTVDVAIGEHEAEGVRKKPAPDTVNEALRQLGKTRQGAVYVGDSEVDLLTARNSQLPCISVLWGFRDRDVLLENGATTFVEKPAELLNL